MIIHQNWEHLFTFTHIHTHDNGHGMNRLNDLSNHNTCSNGVTGAPKSVSTENTLGQQTYVDEERNDEHDDGQFQVRILYGVEESQLQHQ